MGLSGIYGLGGNPEHQPLGEAAAYSYLPAVLRVDEEKAIEGPYVPVNRPNGSVNAIRRD